MEIRPEVLVTVLGMALVTYATRVGGLVLVSRVKLSGRAERWLTQLPGAVLIAIVVPEVIKSGIAGMVAGLITVVVAWRSSSMLLAMVLGVLSIFGLRWVFGSL